MNEAKCIRWIIILRTTTTGVMERMTMLLSTHIEIVKDAAWLNDEAIKSGVFFSLSRYWEEALDAVLTV